MTRSYVMYAVILFAGCNASAHKDEGGKGESAAKLAPGERATSNPFSKSAEAVIEGRKIYLKNGCSGCHGMGGGGGMGKPLIDDEWKFGSDDPTLFKLIRGEIPQQTMPNAIGKALTDDEVWKVLLYVRSVYAGDPSKINWVAPPPVSAEMLAAATHQGGDPVAAGKQIFMAVCTPCHGPEGKGDGPASVSLDPKPRNLTDPGYMTSLNDRYLFELVSRGGIAVGKSNQMPPQPSLSAQDLTNLIAFVRTLSGPPK
ncbi:MAG TPA: c-type cytochrome [Kofleriaceae bacterium]|nr:c-type cytochrome [Kofleriaceae bacterium]